MLDSKILSDLRCGKTHTPTKENIINIVFTLELSLQEAIELLLKAGYDLSDVDNSINNKSLDKLIDEEIIKYFKDEKEERQKLHEKWIDLIFINLIKQQNFNMTFEDISNKIDNKLYYAKLEHDRKELEELKKISKKNKYRM